MNAPLRMLLWTEWRQRRVQFVVCLLWMVLGTLYCVAYELSREFRAPVASFYQTASLFALFAPVFIAMRTSLGEITDRTKSFSDALPASLCSRSWVRLAGGAGVLTAPIAVGAVLLSVCLATGWLEQAPPRPPSDIAYVKLMDRGSLPAISAVGMAWQVTAIVACSATMLYILLSLLGTSMRAESHLGFAGAVIAIIWFLAGGLQAVLESAGPMPFAAWLGAIVPDSMIISYGYGHEQGSFGDLSLSRLLAGPLLVNVMLQMGVAMMFIRRYGRRLPRRAAEAGFFTARRVRRLRTVPLPTRTVALSWLTLRQSVPLCLPGLVLAGIMAPLNLEHADFDERQQLARRLIDVLPSSMWAIGLLWSVVVGAGVLAAEVDSRIGEFWRSWPVSAWRLFAVKFLIGLAAVLLVLDGTIIVASWNSPNWADYHSMNWPYIACIVPLHASMYAVAVAWTCVLRRPVLGGLAAIATFTIVTIAVGWSPAISRFDPIDVYNRLNNMGPIETHGPLDFTAHGYPVVATVMGMTLLVSILVGWWGLRRYEPSRPLTQ